MIIALLLAATPFPALRDATTDGKSLFLLSDASTIARVQPGDAPVWRTLPPSRRVDPQHVEQEEQVTRSPDGRLFVLSQSRNAGPLQGSVVELDPDTLSPRGERWTFTVTQLPSGRRPVRGEARLDAAARLLVARADDDTDGAALFAAPLPKEPGEVALKLASPLDGPMNGGSRFLTSTRGATTLVATTGRGAQLISLTTSGSLDVKFGDGGLARVPEVIALGGLVSVKEGWLVTGGGGAVVAVRLLSNGARDRSWGKEGVVTLRVREGWLEHNPVAAMRPGGPALVVASYEQKEAVLRSTLVQFDARGAQRATEPIEQPAVLQLRVIALVTTGGRSWAVVNTPAGVVLPLAVR